MRGWGEGVRARPRALHHIAQLPSRKQEEFACEHKRSAMANQPEEEEIAFVYPPSANLYCPICQELFKNPVITKGKPLNPLTKPASFWRRSVLHGHSRTPHPLHTAFPTTQTECSHSFCQLCIFQIENSLCPLCRHKVYFFPLLFSCLRFASAFLTFALFPLSSSCPLFVSSFSVISLYPLFSPVFSHLAAFPFSSLLCSVFQISMNDVHNNLVLDQLVKVWVTEEKMREKKKKRMEDRDVEGEECKEETGRRKTDTSATETTLTAIFFLPNFYLPQELPCYCKFRKYGCTTVTGVSNQQVHQDHCPYAPKPCPHHIRGCKFEGLMDCEEKRRGKIREEEGERKRQGEKRERENEKQREFLRRQREMREFS